MIPVYDAMNHDRLLGYHPRWSDSYDERHFVGGKMPSVTCTPTPLPLCASITLHQVSLRRIVKRSDNGWKAEVALVTSAPLEHLLMLREFRLPGEDEYEAEERRWRKRTY